MRPDAIMLLFKEAFDVFPPIKGKPTNDLLAIREVLLPILMGIPFDLLGGVHSLTAILMDDTKYAAEHGGMMFVRPKHLPPLYDDTIANNASTVVRVHAEAAHKSCLKDYASDDAAKFGCAKFLHDVVVEV